ncbi:MAG: DUF2322 family protein [Gammaproteobacteria bacterium]|nr:DUF2322 family protein [Gammaproteobacteria bacterium]
MPRFADTLRTLPSVEHIARLELSDADGQPAGIIENRPGSAGSVAVYHAVTYPDGCLDRRAAEQALTLYAEHTADARAHPGKHPNIDRLFALIDGDQRLQVGIVLR